MIAKIVKYISIFFILAVFNNHLFAADIYKWEPYSDLPNYNWVQFIVIDGEIQFGDFKKFKEIFRRTKTFKQEVGRICISILM